MQEGHHIAGDISTLTLAIYLLKRVRILAWISVTKSAQQACKQRRADLLVLASNAANHGQREGDERPQHEDDTDGAKGQGGC